MKQKITNPKTRSKRDRRKQPPRRGTRFTYEAELFWTQHHRATIIIEARSLKEAEQKADELSSEDIDNWEPIAGDLFVDSVQLVAGGSNHA